MWLAVPCALSTERIASGPCETFAVGAHSLSADALLVGERKSTSPPEPALSISSAFDVTK
jgi:hypothetical protein